MRGPPCCCTDASVGVGVFRPGGSSGPLDPDEKPRGGVHLVAILEPEGIQGAAGLTLSCVLHGQRFWMATASYVEVVRGAVSQPLAGS